MNRLALLLVVISSTAVLFPAVGAAQDTRETWEPSVPDGVPDDFDWIRLPSDEWLKGEIISMYDGVLEFDSDELDDLSFDFDDIKEIRSAHVVQVGFEDKEPVIGRLILDADTARVIGEEGEVEFPRSEILTLIVGTPKEINYWSAYATVGGNIRSGNTDQVDYTARLGAMRRSIRNRIDFDYLGNITSVDSEETSNNHRATVGWDYFLSQRLYVNVIGVEWYRDEFQNIKNRWTATAGLGYEIIDTGRTSWNVTAGPAWQSTEYYSVEEGQDDTTDSPALAIGTRFDHEITKDIDFYFDYTALFTDEENGTYNHHLDTGLDIEIIGNLDFNISWIWDLIEDPRTLEDGSVPEQDDYRLIFGLGWDF
jgi:putative salt-induced outer membrane protein YdiY